ncbi:hypothetical protein AFK68_25435 [Hydrocoleum sp. CS-953]|uniref:hypothetical protein n=1 Tax=Hydrocoleum sp. CS-953 TaxID=1671698 RepID=UPI000B9C6754|nr:hypothetical protein [Hydrocoleum sp. CS-953]OZH52271.1 hypothetical protein AFK68_25435 [Hydrocoleum sp. CS-953]
MLTSNTPKTQLSQPENLSEMTMEKMLDKIEEICKLALSLIHAIKNMRQLYQHSQNQIQQLQEKVNYLEVDNRNKDDKIQELECLAYFESPNGDAICNSPS